METTDTLTTETVVPAPQADAVQAKEAPEPQEEFDPARAMETIKKLRGYEKMYKAAEKQLEEVKKAEEAKKQENMSEAEKLKAQLDKTERELIETRRSVMIQEVARETGLPDKLAQRLQGNNRDELIADAQALVEALQEYAKTTTKVTPPIQPTNPGGAQVGETEAQRRSRLQGRGQSIFSPDAARKAGGGVIFKSQE